MYANVASFIANRRHARPDYAYGMIDNALVLLSLFWLAVQPITDLADTPVVALDRLLDQLLGYQFQLAPFSGFIDGERGLANGVGEQRS